MVEIWLPFPPSANALWRSNRGRVHKSVRYSEWLNEAAWEAKSQRAGKIKGTYKLSITAARPDKRKRDLDNLFKPVSDLLKSIGAIEDDYLCEMLTARWVTTGDGVAIRLESASTE